MRPHLCTELSGAESYLLSPPCCSFYSTSIPPMPTIDPVNDFHKHDDPLFSSFLSRNRFIHRSRMVKKQYNSFINHPLLLEMLLHKPKALESDRKELAMHLRRFNAEGAPFYASQYPYIPGLMSKKCINTNDGSSIGNVSIFSFLYIINESNLIFSSLMASFHNFTRLTMIQIPSFELQ